MVKCWLKDKLKRENFYLENVDPYFIIDGSVMFIN